MTGNQPRRTPKNQISRMPSRKEGKAVPVSANTAEPASNAVSFLTADKTPRGTPIRIAKESEKKASVRVTGRASLKP